MADLLEVIRAEREKRPKIWRKIADFILRSPVRALGLKLREFSISAGVSEGSVINFVRSLGYDGFVEFKVAVAQSQGSFNTRYAEGNESLGSIVASAKLALDDAVLNIDENEITALAERIARLEGRVLVCGKATSGYIAKIFSGYLVRIGIPAFAPDEYELAARTLCDKDILIAITYSGATEEIFKAVDAAKEQGAFTAAFTSFETSRIARAADSVLLMRISEAEAGEFPLIARIVELVFCDAVCSAVVAIKNSNLNI